MACKGFWKGIGWMIMQVEWNWFDDYAKKNAGQPASPSWSGLAPAVVIVSPSKVEADRLRKPLKG
jgi:hypothetical protein